MFVLTTISTQDTQEREIKLILTPVNYATTFALKLTRHKYDKRASDQYHRLPIRRNHIFWL